MATAHVVGFVLLLWGAFQDVPGPAAQATPATPLDAASGIIAAFQQHRVVCLGGAHGDRLGEAFHLSLIQDPRLPSVVQDVVLETGNSRDQDVVDRFVNGEEVAQTALEQVWLDRCPKTFTAEAAEDAETFGWAVILARTAPKNSAVSASSAVNP